MKALKVILAIGRRGIGSCNWISPESMKFGVFFNDEKLFIVVQKH